MARSVDSKWIAVLVDRSHWLNESDSTAGTGKSGTFILHTHIATAPSRFAPGEEPCDFRAFATALAGGGYRGKMAVECKFQDRSPEGLRRVHDTLANAFLWPLRDATGENIPLSPPTPPDTPQQPMISEMQS